MINCSKDRERFQPNYSGTAAVLVSSLSRLHKDTFVPSGADVGFNHAKNFLNETQKVEDKNLGIESLSDAWAFTRAKEALIKAEVITDEFSELGVAKKTLHEYLIKLSSIQALCLDRRWNLVSKDDIEVLLKFFSCLYEIELVRSFAHHIPQPDPLLEKRYAGVVS